MSPKEKGMTNQPFDTNDKNQKEFIDSVCSEMLSPWEPKLLMDVFILAKHHKDYNVIKHVN